MDKEAERLEFDAAARKGGYSPHRSDDGSYSDPSTHDAYYGYQAGCAAASKQEVNADLLAALELAKKLIDQSGMIAGNDIEKRIVSAIARAEQAKQKEGSHGG